MFQVRPNGDHRKEFQESPICEAEPSDQGEFQVGPQSKVQVRRRWQQDSPSPGEAQVETIHQIQVRPAKDQIHQAQVKPKGDQSYQERVRPKGEPVTSLV